MAKLKAVASEETWRSFPVGEQVRAAYLGLAKQVLAYEQQWFGGWRERVDAVAAQHLKRPVFMRDADGELFCHGPPLFQKRADCCTLLATPALADTGMRWQPRAAPPLICPARTTPARAGTVRVNFHPDLHMLMLEARYLDRKGFKVPPLALRAALQEGQYREWCERLEGCLAHYYKVRPQSAALGGRRL